MSGKRKRGPKEAPPEQKRNNRISIFLTGAEFEIVKNRAGNIRLPIYVRAAALAADGVQSVRIDERSLQVWRQTAGLQNNLNQLVRKLNQAGADSAFAIEARDLVARLRAELIGVAL